MDEVRQVISKPESEMNPLEVLAGVKFKPLPRDNKDSSSRPTVLTIWGKTYHQLPNEQPIIVEEIRYQKTLSDSEQQPHVRKVKLSTMWEKVDTGILVNPSYITITNNYPIPTIGMSKLVEVSSEGEGISKTVMDEDHTHVVEISTDPDSNDSQWLLHPGESFRGRPRNIREVFIRSRVNGVKATIIIYPS